MNCPNCESDHVDSLTTLVGGLEVTDYVCRACGFDWDESTGEVGTQITITPDFLSDEEKKRINEQIETAGGISEYLKKTDNTSYQNEERR